MVKSTSNHTYKDKDKQKDQLKHANTAHDSLEGVEVYVSKSHVLEVVIPFMEKGSRMGGRTKEERGDERKSLQAVEGASPRFLLKYKGCLLKPASRVDKTKIRRFFQPKTISLLGLF